MPISTTGWVMTTVLTGDITKVTPMPNTTIFTVIPPGAITIGTETTIIQASTIPIILILVCPI